MNRLARVVCGCLLLGAAWSVTRAHEGEEIGGVDGGTQGAALFNVSCANGFAGPYPCRNVDLLAYLPRSMIGGGQSVADLWGWTDPQTAKEYALVGRSSGTAFVDLSTPANPVYVGDLPTQTDASSWREIKTYQNYALVVSEAEFHGMQVFDLTQLRAVATPPVTFTASAHYGGFSTCHNIVLNEASGFAYAVGTNTCAGGLHMIDVRNPLQPAFAGCFSADGYTHDAQCVNYAGPDARYRGHEVCFNSNEDTLTIVDVTNKSAPMLLSRTSYTGWGYVHQGWLTADQGYFLLDDEYDELTFDHNTRTYVWDVSNLLAPLLIGNYTASTAAIDHNQFTWRFPSGEYTFQANYRAGLRILQLDNLAQAALHEVAYFDIFPPDDAAGFNAAWGNYPFFASGIVIVSGIEQGLFILQPDLDAASPTPTPSSSCAAAPSAGCRGPGNASLVLEDKTPKRRKLVWKWRNGPATTAEEFGDPVDGSTGYEICVYDASGDTPNLVVDAAVAAAETCPSGRPCWKRTGRGATAGFSYYRRQLDRSGLLSVALVGGLDGKARITVKATRQAFSPPPPAAADRLLNQDHTVTVQIRRTDNGACWQAAYPSAAVVNTVNVFKDSLP